MYEFHGWIVLCESPSEIDSGSLTNALMQVRLRIAELGFDSTTAQMLLHNGRHTLVINGYPNRRRSEAVAVKKLLQYLADLLPGSYGLVYEGDEGVELPAGRGLFTVTVVKRGQLVSTLDPFLSPTIPAVEDAE